MSNSGMPSPREREVALFALAVEKPVAERRAFLQAVCGADDALRRRLESSLAAHEQPEALPGDDAGAATVKATTKIESAGDPKDEAVGQEIGHYKILEQVGEGGCGVVYVAEQTEPVRRRVALKVIKLGMDTKQVVARFEAERQALAMMDHPNIAKVLDAGSTEAGRPYFVMELVRGIRITEYCDLNNLPTKERLALAIKICQAIQHAHQKGIIHRDIKPSNILVTLQDGEAVPKVIDFGIAKATEGRLTDSTVYTQLHQVIGTPAYMSPEQAEMSGLDIDTRSDIYSLGVLLYELLAGSTPFDAKELLASGIDAMRKTIREREPVRPSTRLATLKREELTATAKRRSAEAPKLISLLKGDLDWIVMKCLEKDRARRYETANGLAADILRHLNNEPVVARPPSKLYEFQKTVRRHKFGFAAAAAIIIVLMGGVALTTWQAVRATRAEFDALTARARAEANEKEATAARTQEASLRAQAQANERAARRRSYAMDMYVCGEAVAGDNLGRALDLLNRQRPQPGQEDLRGWEWRYLWQQTRSDAKFTLCQKSGEINSLAVSADGRRLVVGERQRGGLSVWDLPTRQEMIHLAPNSAFPTAAFSPTEPLLAYACLERSSSGQRTNRLRLYNISTRQLLAERGLESDCLGLAFARHGRTLVTYTVSWWGARFTLWGIPEATQLASFPAPCGQDPYSPGALFAVTQDLDYGAFACYPNRVGVMDLHTGKVLWTAVATSELLQSMAFSPDGKTLATGAGYHDSIIRLWNVATGSEVGKLAGHDSWVSSLVFLPGGKRLASSSADRSIRIWDIATQKCLEALRGHRQEVWRLAVLADGRTLISGCKDGTVSFWDLSVPHPHSPHITVPEQVRAWSFTSGGSGLVTVDAQGHVAQWPAPDFAHKAPLFEVGTNWHACCFSSDGAYAAFQKADGMLAVWDLSQPSLLHQLATSNSAGLDTPLSLFAHGTKLIVKSPNELFRELNLATGAEEQSWRPPSQAMPYFAKTELTPDERSWIAIGYGGEADYRNLEHKQQVSLHLDQLEVNGVRFSPDGRLFAVASSLGYGRVWDTATWRQVATLSGFLTGAGNLSFSPEGSRLAISSNDAQAVKLWDTESWQEVFALTAQGPADRQGVCFSSDGNTIAVETAGERNLWLWHAPSWAEIRAAEAREVAEAQQP